MIRISAFPKCWIEEIVDGRMALAEWIDASVALACDGLEMYAPFFKSFDEAHLAGVRRHVESLGMCIPMMCYSPDFTAPDEAARKKEIDAQKRMIRATAALGGSFCRTLSGQRRPEVSRAQGIDYVVACIEACLPTAEDAGVTLAIENHFKDGYWRYPEFAQKMDVFLEILARIDSPLLGVQYDPSNALVAGDDPLALLDAVLPRVVTVHASDRFLAPGASLEDMRQADGTLGYPKALCHGATGKGMIDYDAVFSRLRQAGFNGWVSIEDGMNGMDEMIESVDFLKRMRDKYWGPRA